MKNNIDNKIRVNLMKIIADKNITQIEVGKICNKTNKTVSNWLNGKSSPSATDIKAICQYFKISADKILGIGDD